MHVLCATALGDPLSTPVTKIQHIHAHVCDICDPTWDLVPLGVNVYFLVDELSFLVVKTIRKYSF